MKHILIRGKKTSKLKGRRLTPSRRLPQMVYPSAFEMAVPKTESELRELQAQGFFVSKIECWRSDFFESQRVVMKRPIFFYKKKSMR